MKNIKFRENWSNGKVDVYLDDRVVYSSREYKFAAEYVMRNHGVTESQMHEIYTDYKEDYDS
ncbi:hypothetical protein Xoosp13_85 [Xanthomonas phage Xoo-sp13]|nr:hypothetical protein Xoosp13_85 [Xanthomonas phage Xoo-sp13]